jgi:hypothetical protein
VLVPFFFEISMVSEGALSEQKQARQNELDRITIV